MDCAWEESSSSTVEVEAVAKSFAAKERETKRIITITMIALFNKDQA